MLEELHMSLELCLNGLAGLIECVTQTWFLTEACGTQVWVTALCCVYLQVEVRIEASVVQTRSDKVGGNHSGMEDH